MSQAGRRTPAALAIDVGGTKIAAALVDQDGNILSLRTVPTGNPGDNSLRRAASLGEQVAATAEELGKNIGDDLAEGKSTLPLIYAMDRGSAAERHMIREAIETGGTQNLTSIHLAIQATGGLQYTAERAREEAETAIRALDRIPKTPYREGLIKLARFAVNRRY